MKTFESKGVAAHIRPLIGSSGSLLSSCRLDQFLSLAFFWAILFCPLFSFVCAEEQDLKPGDVSGKRNLWENKSSSATKVTSRGESKSVANGMGH